MGGVLSVGICSKCFVEFCLGGGCTDGWPQVPAPSAGPKCRRAPGAGVIPDERLDSCSEVTRLEGLEMVCHGRVGMAKRRQAGISGAFSA
jgi:hypothetical protein